MVNAEPPNRAQIVLQRVAVARGHRRQERTCLEFGTLPASFHLPPVCAASNRAIGPAAALRATLGTPETPYGFEDLAKGPEVVEGPVALALVFGIPVELALFQFFPQSLGGLEERPVGGDAVPAVQAATGGLLSIARHGISSR
jgi:hypothetical protein